jgi:hypothetical protein
MLPLGGAVAKRLRGLKGKAFNARGLQPPPVLRTTSP